MIVSSNLSSILRVLSVNAVEEMNAVIPLNGPSSVSGACFGSFLPDGRMCLVLFKVRVQLLMLPKI